MILRPEVQDLIRQLEAATGKPVELKGDAEMLSVATLVLARPHMPATIITYKEGQNLPLDFAIAARCVMGLHMLSVPPEYRFVAVTQPKHRALIEAAIHVSLAERPSTLPPEALAGIMPLWVDGIVRQVTSLPCEIWVERHMYQAYPALLAEERAWLARELQGSIRVMSPPVALASPQNLLELSAAMNYARFAVVGKTVGENYVRWFNQYPRFLKLGKKVAAVTEAFPWAHGNYTDAVELAERWTDVLGIRGWFAWARLDETAPEV